ncbi:lysylphosphatidylglycerol synthase transmembrane domain-containing protein [Hufsiella ginkgonis]|uniref:Flippase-like domain-containing protein n=1 Tax=Hufsiella ginkgonis TaxID=2695274 RepID=A0A7K1XUE9_9SPHI|nr:lysylphosphatidylglycerol synthase transmembrane domain-containing protein [Hufsiella ginkgonis]MXV14427.1 flippase-like domain-containing protein [Hufsiella ginkgonis]
MDRQKLWGILKIVLKTAVTFALLYFVFQKIDVRVLKTYLLRSNPWYLLLALVLYICSQLVSSSRSLGLIRSIGINLDAGFNLRLYMLGMFYNVFLPGGVGGDGYKIYILRKKYELPTKRILLAMFFDRLSGLWAIGLLAVALIILIPQIDIHAGIPIAVLVAGTVIYYLVMRRFFKDYTTYFLSTHGKAIVVQALQLAAIVCILLSQSFNGKFAPYLFSYFLSALAANIPAGLPGGIGLREYAMTHTAGYFHIDQGLAVFMSITFYVISTLTALTGVWYVYRSTEFAPPPKQKEAKAFEEQADDRLIEGKAKD